MHQRSLANYVTPSSKEFNSDCTVEDLSMSAEPDFKRQRIESEGSEGDPELERDRHQSQEDDNGNVQDNDEVEDETAASDQALWNLQPLESDSYC